MIILFPVDEEDEVSIAEAAKVIQESVGFKGTLEFDTTQADGQYKKTASNKKLRSLLPDFQFTNFQSAIKESVDWYIENKTTARNWCLQAVYSGVARNYLTPGK